MINCIAQELWLLGPLIAFHLLLLPAFVGVSVLLFLSALPATFTRPHLYPQSSLSLPLPSCRFPWPLLKNVKNPWRFALSSLPSRGRFAVHFKFSVDFLCTQYTYIHIFFGVVESSCLGLLYKLEVRQLRKLIVSFVQLQCRRGAWL